MYPLKGYRCYSSYVIGSGKKFDEHVGKTISCLSPGFSASQLELSMFMIHLLPAPSNRSAGRTCYETTGTVIPVRLLHKKEGTLLTHPELKLSKKLIKR